MLPPHGQLKCRTCFGTSTQNCIKPNSTWKIVNDPGAWGGNTSPDYLVLGFSKGATQANIYKSGKFEDVAFAGMRPRLTQALRAVGALSEDEIVDNKISDPKSNIAFGSLIRCSVSRIDEKASSKKGKEVYACTGPLITKSFSEIPQVIKNCANNFLTDLPSSIRIVFLLSNSDGYVEGCQSLLRDLFPEDYRQINAMSVYANGRKWIHLAHASGLNGHFNTWLNSGQGPGRKRLLAIEGVNTY